MYQVGPLLYGADRIVIPFVAARIRDVSDFGPCTSIGVVRGGVIIGGVIYHGFRKDDGDIQVSIAFDSPRWATRQTLAELFAYAFVTLDCVRMTAFANRRNKRSRRLLEGLGFRLEGIARKAVARRNDACMYGLLRDECRWLRKDHGQEHTASPRAA